MNSEHIISLIRSNFNNIDDLKKILSAVECSIEALDEEEPTPEPLPATLQQLKQMQHATIADANGTSLRGYIATTYNNLVKTFGLPTFEIPASQMDKVTIEWILQLPNGSVVTIYDWKGYGYKPKADEVYEWHIGGLTSSVVEFVKTQLGLIQGSGPFFDLGK